MLSFPKAILFDHDGVLVASEHLHWDAWRMLFSELAIPYEEAMIQAAVGQTAPRILTEILDLHRPRWSLEQYDIHLLSQRKNDFYLDIAKAKLRAYPGVKEGLKWLKAIGIATAVVSNAKRRELEAALKQLDIISYFDLIISRDDVSPAKPDPTPYLVAAASLELDPGECLAVEDSPPGLEAALMAKIPTAAVMTNFPRQVVESPVPGRPDLKPVWVGASIRELFEDLVRWIPTRTSID